MDFLLVQVHFTIKLLEIINQSD